MSLRTAMYDNISALRCDELEDTLGTECKDLIVTEVYEHVGTDTMVAVLVETDPETKEVKLYGRGLYTVSSMQWLHLTCDGLGGWFKPPQDWLGIEYLKAKKNKVSHRKPTRTPSGGVVVG